MMAYTWLLALLFLPLFPFSAAFVFVIKNIRHPWLRSALFLLWPQVGVWLLVSSGVVISEGLLYWAMSTALLYALRALVLRDVSLWLSYIGISCWSILWIVLISLE